MAVIRCTRPDCRSTFEISSDRLGKNLCCIRCGALISAMPLDLGEGVDDVVSDPSSLRRLPLEALVEDVRSLWNVGSIFRSADGAGVRHLHLCGITGQPPRREIRKTALGAEDAVEWSHAKDALTRARKLSDGGALLVALEATDRSFSCLESRMADVITVDERRPVCMIVGNEVAGVSPALLDLAPVHVALPMRGRKRSLNVAVAFGVGIYALAETVAR